MNFDVDQVFGMDFEPIFLELLREVLGGKPAPDPMFARIRPRKAPAAAPEPLRSPLDWNKPRPFDAFKGYEVSTVGEMFQMDCEPFAGLQLDGPPAAAHQVAPMFGSAFLRD